MMQDIHPKVTELVEQLLSCNSTIYMERHEKCYLGPNAAHRDNCPMHYRPALEAKFSELMWALEESVKLQSFQAQLLNDYDGGKRMAFKNAQEWLDRLTFLAEKKAVLGREGGK